MSKARPTPGQINLAGKALPDEPVNRMLVKHGFKPWRDQGSMLYTDPFRPAVHLDARKAKKLLRERMDVVVMAGFRVRYPQTHYSEVRMGQRRATQHGAWHELHAACGPPMPSAGLWLPPPGYWIIDGATILRVWPPAQEPGTAALADSED